MSFTPTAGRSQFSLSFFTPRKHAFSRSERRPWPRRSGLTLIEILISTAVTMIMIFAIVEIFERVGSAVAQGRAAIEMSGQIRGAAHRLREDIRAVTVPMRPWPRPSSAEGYFEIYEGALRDTWNPATDSRSTDTRFGDPDDLIMMTVRSVNEPFVGRFNGNAIESQVAEIIWWTRLDPNEDVNGNGVLDPGEDINRNGVLDQGNDLNGNGLLDPGEFLTLHRRVLLVRPDLNNASGLLTNFTTSAQMIAFLDSNDISVRFERDPSDATGNTILGMAANSLADLTKRENRFAHNPLANSFPHSINFNFLLNVAQGGLHQGDDIVLSHVQAFDIRVFDPLASIRTDSPPGNGRALIPSDPGWAAAVSNGNTELGRGAFVDMNYLGAAGSVFSGPVHPLSQLQLVLPVGAATYDTWSFHYEHDGFNQDWPLLPQYAGETWRQTVDQGTDGIDNNYVPPPPNPPPSSNGPDDVYERETSPPYPVPLRGIQIRIRIDDPDSRQVREASVVNEFIPE